MKRSTLLLAVLLAVAAAVAAPAADLPAARAPRFAASDPVWRDVDQLNVPARPSVMDWAGTWDALTNTLRGKPQQGRIPPARGVNTLGEVPDSSWFENRIGVREMSVAQIVRGPNRDDGPDMNGTWTVMAASRAASRRASRSRTRAATRTS